MVAPPPTPPWSVLLSQEQKCSGHPSKLFLGRGGVSILSEPRFGGKYSKIKHTRCIFLNIFFAQTLYKLYVVYNNYNLLLLVSLVIIIIIIIIIIINKCKINLSCLLDLISYKLNAFPSFSARLICNVSFKTKETLRHIRSI